MPKKKESEKLTEDQADKIIKEYESSIAARQRDSAGKPNNDVSSGHGADSSSDEECAPIVNSEQQLKVIFYFFSA